MSTEQATQLIPVRQVTTEQARAQIELRLKVIAQMVGQLYPSILYDEIAQLRQVLWKGLR